MRAVFNSFAHFRRGQFSLLFFFISPLLTIILHYLVVLSFKGNISDFSLKLIIIASCNIQAIVSVSSSLIHDRNVQIQDRIAYEYRFSIFYWLTKFAVNIFSTTTVALISLIIQSLLSGIFSNTLKFLGFSILISFYMTMLGICLTVFAGTKKNPYFGTNIFSTYIFAFSCAVVPLVGYNSEIKGIVYLYPMGNTIDSIESGTPGFFYDMLYSFLIFAVTLLFLKFRKEI